MDFHKITHLPQKDIIIIIILILAILIVVFLFRIIVRILLFTYIKLRYGKGKKVDTTPEAKKMNQNIATNSRKKIVGFAKPVGFFTSLILGDALTKTFSAAKSASLENDSKSFWENVAIEQEKEQKEKDSKK
ncbi:MAG: hypothetical protein Ta2D_09260 [Rickettsiales bacterium]|nr:MAG: hypothetical protein Ta2D_09260 [Rickettsiales bacterium]